MMKTDEQHLADALGELRRWFDHEVGFAAAERVMRERGMAPMLACGCCTREPGDRRSGAFDSEIRKAARGQEHAPIEWLWILEVQNALTDEQIATILNLKADDPVEAARKMRQRANGWWTKRAPKWAKEYPELAAMAEAKNSAARET